MTKAELKENRKLEMAQGSFIRSFKSLNKDASEWLEKLDALRQENFELKNPRNGEK